MQDALEAILGLSIGFSFYQLFTSPSHSFKIEKLHPSLAKKLRLFKKYIQKIEPEIKVKHVEILPNIRIKFNKNRVIWIHHWIPLSIVLGFLAYHYASFGQLLVVKGMCAGGVLQGFLYKDRFKILHHLDQKQV